MRKILVISDLQSKWQTNDAQKTLYNMYKTWAKPQGLYDIVMVNGDAFIDYTKQQIRIPYNYEFKIGELITTLKPGRFKTHCIIDISKSQIIYAEVIVL
jgi:hypothetical protein